MPNNTNSDEPRCSWASNSDQMILYHDKEWGKPTRDSQALFELLCLEGAQAGLSWQTILHRRDGYRRAFEAFNPRLLAKYGESDVGRLMQDTGIIRNRLKIQSVIENARAYLHLASTQSFSDFIWSYVDYNPLSSKQREKAMLIATQLSKDLKQNGFSFVGPTILFAYMQSAGLIHDHEVGCFLA